MTPRVIHSLPSFVESEPQVVRIKLSTPPLLNSIPHQTTPRKADREMGAWASLLSHNGAPLTNNSSNANESVYVHPLVKNRSDSILSARSLEMCTESLGSETGGETGYDFPREEIPSRSRHCGAEARRRFGGARLPPPLPSLGGSGGVHVKRHREDGRLVVRAFSVASPQACFRAERHNGRLRLCFRGDDYDDVEQGRGVYAVYEDDEGETGGVSSQFWVEPS